MVVEEEEEEQAFAPSLVFLSMGYRLMSMSTPAKSSGEKQQMSNGNANRKAESERRFLKANQRFLLVVNRAT